MVKVSRTKEFQQAVEALKTLKRKTGPTKEVQAIGLLLAKIQDQDFSESVLRFVGDKQSQADIDVRNAYQEELKRLLAGEDDDYAEFYR